MDNAKQILKDVLDGDYAVSDAYFDQLVNDLKTEDTFAAVKIYIPDTNQYWQVCVALVKK